MIKKTFKFFWFLGCGFLIASIIFEISLRAIEAFPSWRVLPVAEVSLYGPDAETAYTHRSNVKGIWTTENRAKVSTNSFGIRSNGNQDEVIESTKGWYKVGLIGDSITEALQVNDHKTFSALIEKKLQADGKKVRVYNLGLAGATPAIVANRTKYFSELLDLDLVVIIDDPHSISHRLDKSAGGTLPYYKEKEEGGFVIERPYLNSRSYKLKTSGFGKVMYFLIDNFRVFAVLNNRLNRGFFDELTSQLKIINNYEVTQEDKIECNKESLAVLKDIEKPEMKKRRKLLDAFIEDLSSIKKQFNAEVVLALYDIWPDCPADLEVQSRRQLKSLLNSHGLEFFDLKESLKGNISSEEELKDLRGFGTNRGGGHLNERGHEVFAETISELL